MAVNLNWTTGNGDFLASLDFPVTGPGQSRFVEVVCTNTGDSVARNAMLEIGAVGNMDLEQWLWATAVGTVGTARVNQPVTIGDMAPGATLKIGIHLDVPQGAPLSTKPVMALCQVTYDLED